MVEIGLWSINSGISLKTRNDGMLWFLSIHCMILPVKIVLHNSRIRNGMKDSAAHDVARQDSQRKRKITLNGLLVYLVKGSRLSMAIFISTIRYKENPTPCRIRCGCLFITVIIRQKKRMNQHG